MKAAIAALLSALTIGSVCHAQAPLVPAPSANMPPSSQPDGLDHFRRSTVSFGIIGDDKKFKTICSGVIVAVDLTHVAIVTAKHCFYDPADQFFPTQLRMRIPTDRKEKTGDDLGVVLFLKEGERNLWQSPADGSDLAAIQVPPIHDYMNLHAIDVRLIGGDIQTYQGASILALGYPAIVSEQYLTTPIARGGIISWTDPIAPSQKRFLIDANIFQGNSGGPVFSSGTGPARLGGFQIGGGYALIGIVVEDAGERAPVFYGDKEHENKLSITEQDTGKVDQVFAKVLNIGSVGVVEPASKIKPLLGQLFGEDVVQRALGVPPR